MALKLFSGKHHTKTYPTKEELIHFGRQVCGVGQAEAILGHIAQAMSDTLTAATHDERIPATLLDQLRPVWTDGLRYGKR